MRSCGSAFVALLHFAYRTVWVETGYGRAAVAVSLFAVGNGLGRILAGSLSEVIHQSRLAPRTFNLFFATVIMALAHLLFWLELGTAGLYIGVFMAAFAFGAVRLLPFCHPFFFPLAAWTASLCCAILQLHGPS